MGSLRTRDHNFGLGPALTLALVLAPFAAAAAPPVETSLCVEGEPALFTCSVGRKLVSICQASGKATYRFGTPGHIEMSSDDLFTAEHAFSGGGETQISFHNKSYTYTVYDKTIRTAFSPDGHNDPDFTAGLFVQKNGKTVSSFQCTTDATVATSSAKTIPAGQFIEH